MSHLRDAFRALRAAPAVSAVAILSLALGIGANTAVFSLVDTLLLKSLPVREPERLATLQLSGDRFSSWTNTIWEQIRDREGRLFEGATAWSDQRFDLSGGGEARFVDGFYASGRFFEVFGVPAILGRTFTAADDRRGGGPDGAVAVISYRFWQRHFGGAADAIGRRLTLDRVPFTVIGVMPRSFNGPSAGEAADVVIPIGCEPLLKGAESVLDHPGYWWLNVTVRLKPGQTREQISTAL